MCPIHQVNISNKTHDSFARKKVNGLFDITLKNTAGTDQSWTLDFKTSGSVSLGKPAVKPDVVLTMTDETFVDLANGKLNGQKAFMGGKLKIKGTSCVVYICDGCFYVI